ncbi:hypothetical protein NFA_53930 [Nocardia farcinica IFM 10152]|uniref:Uncharacterized protein n=1 Tax=Nocardia farcinica (strain IFM 10152) TaxID=247156 RepID=Q5YNJ6_NOCFA|nr:hypothetical protein NFA_53930 [Nocardia farcinica IFM 10152]
MAVPGAVGLLRSAAAEIPIHYLTVFSTIRTVEEIRSKPGNTDFTEVTIGGRTGTSTAQFRTCRQIRARQPPGQPLYSYRCFRPDGADEMM